MGKRRETLRTKKRQTEEEVVCVWEGRKRKNFIYHQSLGITLV